MRKVLACAIVIGLSGCAHNLTLMARQGSEHGTGKATDSGSGKGSLTIELGGKIYKGRWVAASGGSMGLIQTFGTNPATGTVLGSDYQSSGNALLTSEDGAGLRCEFRYSGWSSAGYGVCQTDDGRLFDLQID